MLKLPQAKLDKVEHSQRMRAIYSAEERGEFARRYCCSIVPWPALPANYARPATRSKPRLATPSRQSDLAKKEAEVAGTAGWCPDKDEDELRRPDGHRPPARCRMADLPAARERPTTARPKVAP